MLAIAWLGGCTQKPEATEATEYFPLEAGRRWVYRATLNLDDPDATTTTERLELHNTGLQPLEGSSPAWTRLSDSGNAYWLASNASGIHRVAARGPLEPQPRRDAESRTVLPLPLKVGASWSASTTAYVLRRRNQFPYELRHVAGFRSFPMAYQLAARDEALETPAGRFERCLRVDGRAQVRLFVDEGREWQEVPLFTREWYCPGVGLARLERVEASPTRFVTGGRYTLDLLEWR